MKAEKGSEIIMTICEYENSVAMPDNERLTYLDTCGIARLKDGNGNVKAQEAYASRCSEYLRFGHEVDLAACGVYSPYDALKVCDTPEIFLKTGFEQRPMLYTQKHLFQALTPKTSNRKVVPNMKPIEELRTNKDVAEWCRDFLRITDELSPELASCRPYGTQLSHGARRASRGMVSAQRPLFEKPSRTSLSCRCA